MGNAENTVPIQSERSNWDPYAIPSLPVIDESHPHRDELIEQAGRRQLVAALRAMATFVEDNPHLPVPQGVHMQHSIWTGTRTERVAAIQDIAERLGVDAQVDDTRAMVSRHFGDRYDGFEYCVHARLPEPTTAEVVSAALEA